jgi:hypothetical protein
MSAGGQTLTLGMVLSFTLAIGGTACAPSLCELAAPVLCPGALRTQTREIPTKGKHGTAMLSISYCTMPAVATTEPAPQGAVAREVAMSPLTTRAILFAYGSLLSLLAAGIALIISRLRARTASTGTTASRASR